MGRPTACATVEVTEAEVRGRKRIYGNIYPLEPLAKTTFSTNLSFDLPLSHCARPMMRFQFSTSPSKGSGQGCPLLRASDEHIPIVRVLRVRRAPGRSYPSFQACSLSLQESGLIDLPLRVSRNPDARRARQAGQARRVAGLFGLSGWSDLYPREPDRPENQLNQ